MPRKPGGQPGNTNALQHGFYSRKFHRIDLDDLDAGFVDNTIDEIVMLRVCFRKLFGLINDSKAGLEPITYSVVSMASACAKLGHLLRLQKLSGNKGDTFDTLHKALKEIVDELHISI